ncbi:MAG: DEAD/DEAH box helicase [Verrucomicrobiales bacterium]
MPSSSSSTVSARRAGRPRAPLAENPVESFELSPSGALLYRGGRKDLRAAFSVGESGGLIALGGRAANEGTDAPLRYWKGFADTYVRELCQVPDGVDELPEISRPDAASLVAWVLDAPPMRGAEYLSPETLLKIWDRLDGWTRERLAAAPSLASFLDEHAPAWSRVGRVTLHLAEHKEDPDRPFAFLATYASALTGAGRLRQAPLGKALQQYGGAKNKPMLLKLLTPIHAAAGNCPLMKALVESGDIFHPLAWKAEEAYRFLQAIPVYEEAGLLVRLPNWWRKRGTRPQVSAVIGEKKSSAVGLKALLDFRLEVVVDGKALTEAEVETLLAGDEGLVFFQGQWIEVDREKLQEALDHWRSLAADGIPFVEGMRLLAGAPADLGSDGEDKGDPEWAFARAGTELEAMLRRLASPEPGVPPAGLRATLRPYQAAGVDWLSFCARLGLGACLADDMGLGKTVQVLAALLRRKEEDPSAPPSLLVVPASLIGNWRREAEKFTPELRLHIAHRSAGETKKPSKKVLAGCDVVVTTYGMAKRLDWIAETEWGWIVLDEAQAIKNAGSGQSKAVRRLRGEARVALTGTPVENHLGDLWSLFDFLNPGLLGAATRFRAFVKGLEAGSMVHYAPLRRLVAPYILRRLKTDKSIIADLPDKTEMRVSCGLAPAQAQLYRRTAKALARVLEGADGIERRGLVLSYLMRFKQICNHPDQLAKTGDYEAAHSAKFLRLAELCEEIASRGEKVLVFTQFRELTEPLENHLATVFGRGGLVLHGGTAVKRRQEMVERFQREDGPPFFVLSLKAGGTGLNLTAASHVIHFDRWWNPAVENQATDRAFRIGQKKNVLVHKFVVSGTLEEKIDALIAGKQDTADAVLSDGAEKALTEMNDAELLNFVRLDLSRAAT